MKWMGDEHVFNQWLENADLEEAKDYIKKKNAPLTGWKAFVGFLGLVSLSILLLAGVVLVADLIDGRLFIGPDGYITNSFDSKIVYSLADDYCLQHDYGNILSVERLTFSYKLNCEDKTVNLRLNQ